MSSVLENDHSIDRWDELRYSLTFFMFSAMANLTASLRTIASLSTSLHFVVDALVVLQLLVCVKATKRLRLWGIKKSLEGIKNLVNKIWPMAHICFRSRNNSDYFLILHLYLHLHQRIQVCTYNFPSFYLTLVFIVEYLHQSCLNGDSLIWNLS